MQKQMPEAENGNGKNTPTWKWITIAVCLPMIAWFASGYFNNVQGQISNLKQEQDAKTTVLHNRINKLDDDKLEQGVFLECMKSVNEKLADIKEDLKVLKRNTKP